MTYRLTTCVTLAAVATAGPALAAAPPADDELAFLRAEVASLRGRVHELEGADTFAAESRAAEIRELVADAIADANGRASLLQSGTVAGYTPGKGFTLGSQDGNFNLRVKGGLQLRFIASLQDNTADGSGDDTVSGFENTRNRFGFSGNVVDPTWKYNVWGGWNASGGTVLLDAWVAKDLENGWTIKAGQFKLPTWGEWTVAEVRQQFVERSVLDARFAQSYSQGIQAAYAADDWRTSFTFSDGLRTLNGAYNASAASGRGFNLATDFALTARFDYKLSGDWGAVSDFNGFRGDTETMVIGGGIHYQIDESGTAATETEVVEFNLDANLQFDGANVFAAVVYRTLDDDAALDRDELGFLLQGGYFLADDLEVVARYEHGDLDGGGGAAGDDLSLVTVGVTKFWNRHGLKWTTDIGFALDAVDGAWGGTGRGFRADAAGEDGQMVLRSQLQLLF